MVLSENFYLAVAGVLPLLVVAIVVAAGLRVKLIEEWMDLNRRDQVMINRMENDSLTKFELAEHVLASGRGNQRSRCIRQS